MNQNKIKIIIVLSCLLLIAIVAILISTLNTTKPTDPEPEIAGEFALVSINDPTKDLYNNFVDNKYIQIRKHIANYIKQNYGNPNEMVDISNFTSPNRDNDLKYTTFNVSSPSLNKSFIVLIDQPRDASYPATFEVQDSQPLFKVNLLEVDDAEDLHE